MREMKDSGIAWIGEVPKEWEVVRHPEKEQVFFHRRMMDDRFFPIPIDSPKFPSPSPIQAAPHYFVQGCVVNAE